MAREPRTLLRWRYSVHKDMSSAVRPRVPTAGVSSAGSLLACTSDEALDKTLADLGYVRAEPMERHAWFSGGLAKVRQSNFAGTELVIATVLVVITDPRAEDPLREGDDPKWRPGK